MVVQPDEKRAERTSKKVLCVGVVRLGVCNIFFGGPYNQLQSSGSAARKTYLGFNQYIIHPYSGEDQEKKCFAANWYSLCPEYRGFAPCSGEDQNRKKKKKKKKRRSSPQNSSQTVGCCVCPSKIKHCILTTKYF